MIRGHLAFLEIFAAFTQFHTLQCRTAERHLDPRSIASADPPNCIDAVTAPPYKSDMRTSTLVGVFVTVCSPRHLRHGLNTICRTDVIAISRHGCDRSSGNFQGESKFLRTEQYDLTAT